MKLANRSKCTNGELVTESQIKRKLSAAYKEYYLFNPVGMCEACGKRATCTAHIVPKSRLKVLGISEKIWSPELWFRSCFSCNTIAENVASDDIKKLRNFERIKSVIEKYDPERASKL